MKSDNKHESYIQDTESLCDQDLSMIKGGNSSFFEWYYRIIKSIV